jgi:hypothetical protein
MYCNWIKGVRGDDSWTVVTVVWVMTVGLEQTRLVVTVVYP